MTQGNVRIPARLFTPLFWFIIALGLYAASLYNYLLFHSLVELFSVLVAFVIFVLAWNTRRLLDNHYLLFIGIASLASGLLDLMHLLSYEGMGVFPAHGANLPTQLWIAFRFVFSISLLMAVYFVRRKLHPARTLSAFIAITALLLVTIFLKWFPDCFVAGRGLTAFKIVSEYVICLFFVAALGALFAVRRAFDRGVMKLLTASIVCSVLSELSFTQYVSVYGTANMAGHFFELLSYAFIYRALVVTGVVEPSKLLFRDLKRSEEALKESETRFRAIFENSVDAVGVSRGGIHVFVNPAYLSLFGYTSEAELADRSILDLIAPEERGRIREYAGRREQGVDVPSVYETRGIRKDGTEFVMDVHVTTFAMEETAHTLVIIRDITERKRVEDRLRSSHEQLERRVQERTAELVRTNEELEVEIAERVQAEEQSIRLNRLYSVLSRVNEAIVRIHHPVKLYERVCRIAVEDGQFKMAWIGLNDPDTEMVKPMASFGDADGYLNKIKVYADDVSEGRGPTGRAAYEGTYSICSDIEHDPRMLPWRDKALRHGFRSSAAFPLRAGSTVIGAFTIYSDKPRSFTGEEIVLLNSLAEDLSLAIDSMNNETMRLDAEEALRASSEEIRVLYNNGRVTNDLLQLFTRKVSHKEYLDAAAVMIRDWNGCRHVGLRIADEDGTIPYESCVGFSREFLDSENSLSLEHDQCTCIRVIQGSSEPQDLPATTAAGSFYSNNIRTFMSGLAQEQTVRFRGVCLKSGFTSLAVVPIRYRERILGAIHVADEREGMVPLKSVEFLEHMALIIGEALFRFGVEEELRQLNRELEQRVKDRTTQLEDANRELEAFAYSVSHDLRAPLRAIDGFSRVIEEEHLEKLNASGRDYFRRVRAAGQRMAQLIDAMLKLSRLTRGDVNRVRLDLGSLAKTTANELKKSQPKRTVTVDIADHMMVEGDPVMLRIVLENLMGNAWKFTAKTENARIEVGVLECGIGNVECGVKDASHGHQYVTFSDSEIRNPKSEIIYFVRDNGAGFDMTYAKKLFMAFQRLHSADEFPGLGIGLATVQRIIHRHGGRIWAESAQGKGTTFYFTL